MTSKWWPAALLSASILAAGDSDNGPAGTNGQAGVDGVDGTDGTNGVHGDDGADGSASEDLAAAPGLIRLATTPVGAELTGRYATDNGKFFFNVQHPASSLPGDENKATVGAWIGVLTSPWSREEPSSRSASCVHGFMRAGKLFVKEAGMVTTDCPRNG